MGTFDDPKFRGDLLDGYHALTQLVDGPGSQYKLQVWEGDEYVDVDEDEDRLFGGLKKLLGSVRQVFTEPAPIPLAPIDNVPNRAALLNGYEVVTELLRAFEDGAGIHKEEGKHLRDLRREEKARIEDGLAQLRTALAEILTVGTKRA